jgi:DNA sulfur modification protein DndE
MSFNRIRISNKATTLLRILKGRTGLTPNILSRIAFCLSLGEPGVPDPQLYDDEGQEFNRYTLTGEWDLLFISLLKERILKDKLDPDRDLLPQFKAHLNRGVLTLYNRVKSLTDLYDLIPAQNKIPEPQEDKVVEVGQVG